MQKQLQQLYQAIGKAKAILILPHNDPDPDAIASALALRHLLATKLGVEGQIVYRGIVGRAENKVLVRHLEHPLRRLTAADLNSSLPIALVDTQPGAGNNVLPPGRIPAIVFDHHPRREETTAATFADIRPDAGATSTILTEYLQAAGIEPMPLLATALFYGIKTDTLGLGRGAGPADVAAYSYLQSRIDVDALAEIEHAQVPAEYYRRLDTALHAARIYRNVVVSYIGPMSHPDLAAEIADFMLRLRGIRWVICLGTYKDSLVVAVRTKSRRRGGAGNLVREIMGEEGTAGGHTAMAGGHWPLQGQHPELVAEQLIQRALEVLQVPAEEMVKLLSN
jgi:nanoRNase/pAp phosphatase (c-di-AMP/oligoRNAs hydrolase)